MDVAYLDTPDSLLAALLGHFLGEVLPQTGLILFSLLAGLLLGLWSVDGGPVCCIGGALRGVVFALFLLENALSLVLPLGEFGGIMPGVVLGGTVNLGQLFFRWPGARGGTGSRIASDVPEKDGGIVDYLYRRW